jgi:hypothetical protein
MRLEDLKAGYAVAENLLTQIEGMPDELKEIGPWLQQKRDDFLAEQAMQPLETMASKTSISH